MKIEYGRLFKKHFKKRVPKESALEKRYIQRVEMFVINRSNPVLKDHKLTGKLKDFRSFSIKGDFRVVYKQESEDVVTFTDIGTHPQVYG